MSHAPSLDPDEIARFSTMARDWWDPAGPLAPLHRLNPTRLAWLRDRIADHFGRDTKSERPLAGLRILDIGCGGGLVTEPLARMGATVTGIDPASDNIVVARHHAEAEGLAIDYRAETAEALAAAGETFDVVLILEVVEHVTDVAAFVATAGSLVRPGGLLLASTINRTLKAWALAIVGAEYVLRWLPRGTHSYDKLVTPNELAAALVSADLDVTAETGVMYVPLAGRWRLTGDMDVNYMMAAKRPA
ncbi:MAG: bifunctional 2-polyprenyl-6-hydroxyphenol methylase/3-demethylubiquinol 3-O-methyltransferase UbiG [Rhizobiales bacterium]|nr:bifunctional 2-polyprenyl-6-hydroxyphenol methylase/3-demethylubiquinol 3-O-methyltransferase UbiG [Hyphomicrobiales bacterium]